MKLPNNVQYILEKFNSNGFEAFIVGGCVRDSLLNKKPQDYDITTNAFPEKNTPTQIQRLRKQS